jgi:hypothetical protein
LILSTDGRRPSGAQLVDDRVLDLQRAEVGVVDARAMAAELHRQGAVGRQVVGPVDRVHAVVEVFGVLHREALEHQQHAVGQARPEAQAVGGFHVGLPRTAEVCSRTSSRPSPGFFDEQAFKAFGAGEESSKRSDMVFQSLWLVMAATHRPEFPVTFQAGAGPRTRACAGLAARPTCSRVAKSLDHRAV